MNLLTIVGFTLFAAAIIYIVILKTKNNFRHKQDSTAASLLSPNNQGSSSAILQAFSDSVILCETNGTISAMNEAAAKMTGWSAADAQGLDYQSILMFTDKANKPLPREQSPVQMAITNNATVRQTIPLVNKTTKKVTFVDAVVSPINDESGQTKVIAVLRDVSNQVKQDTDRSDFVSTASHEMRTPVAAIRGFLELALNPQICKIDENAQKYLQKAYNSTEHLGKLFQDLLTVSRSEDGRLPNNPVKVNINEFIKSLGEQLRFTTEAKKLSLTIQFDNADINKTSVVAPTYFSFIDPDRLREVITNLFDNAVKYTEKGGISIKLSGTRTSVLLAVHDSGIGIPKDDISHIFQKFYRVDNTATREIGGTGLGLYICQEIAETMHGKIHVESNEGVGSTFTLEIPRVV